MHPNTRDTICCHKKKEEKNRSQTKIKAKVKFEIKYARKKMEIGYRISFMLGFFIRRLSSDVGFCLPLMIIQCHNILKNN